VAALVIVYLVQESKVVPSLDDPFLVAGYHIPVVDPHWPVVGD